ncbi:MAG: hypothetical protein ACRCTL_12720 [Pseudomonas sp.]
MLMSTQVLLIASAASALLLFSLLLQRHWRQLGRTRQGDLQQVLVRCLELLQRLQKHRGLGGQSSREAQQQCQALALEIDSLWRDLPETASELAALRTTWPALRQQPGDFDGHCQLIERLLSLIQLFELRLARADNELALGCRELEELARLRGLAVRGAGAPRCPLPLQVQLRYLSQRLQPRANRQSSLAQILERLRRQLIEPNQVMIAPGECFSLLTPLIDEQLGQLRQRLG